MNTRDYLDNIRLQIMNGYLDEAEAALVQVAPGNTVEMRIKGHHRAILTFHRGDIAAARSIIEETIRVHGENLNLLRDLTICQYHLNDMAGFRANLNQLEILLSELEPRLGLRTILDCELMIGKFLEEEARLAPAALFYERALSRAGEGEARFLALIQVARWQASYQPGNELSGHYRELISFPLDRFTRDQKVELQHALMMIEIRLVGAQHAWQRVERLGRDMVEMDRRLLVFDFIESALAQDLPLQPIVLNIMNEFQRLDPYEEFLKMLIQGKLDHTWKIQELDALASKLPWASYLRLLCLSANAETSAEKRRELNRKISLIVQGLDPRSQKLWNQRLRQALQAPEIKAVLCMRSRTVSVQGKVVDLSKKKIGLQLLGGLRAQSVLPVEDAIQLLWQSGFTPEHYHRLRMSTHRLNSWIYEFTGLGKILEVDSQHVRLRPEVKLTCAEASDQSELFGL